MIGSTLLISTTNFPPTCPRAMVLSQPLYFSIQPTSADSRIMSTKNCSRCAPFDFISPRRHSKFLEFSLKSAGSIQQCPARWNLNLLSWKQKSVQGDFSAVCKWWFHENWTHCMCWHTVVFQWGILSCRRWSFDEVFSVVDDAPRYDTNNSDLSWSKSVLTHCHTHVTHYTWGSESTKKMYYFGQRYELR